MATAASTSGWASLPRDILLDVFLKVGQRDILQGAGLVCAAWWRAARDEPTLWRRIDLTRRDDDDADLCDDFCYSAAKWLFDEDATPSINNVRWKNMARAAIDRSAGQCETFCGRGNDDVLLYLADRAPSLKSICITSHYDVSSKIFIEVVKRFPLLEELEHVLNFSDCKGIYKHSEPSTNCWLELLLTACEACSHLKQFTVRHIGSKVAARGHSHYCWPLIPVLQAIPTMHGLFSLQLSGNCFTRDVVLSMIDACPNLQSLDVSEVENLWRCDQNLRDKCSRVNNLTLPLASFYIEESEDETDDSSIGEDDLYDPLFYDPDGED